MISSACAAIEDLELAARLVVEGLRSGGHRSPMHGYSAEFSQHRLYRPGDDLKYLDWKVLARTDRLYTRQFRESTSMSVMIVLDTSRSMEFGEPVTKFRYAVVAAAALAHLTITQGDSVGLMAGTYLPARSGRMHLRALLAALARLTPHGAWDPVKAIGRGAELLGRRGVVLVLSDFYDQEDAAARELRRTARRGHDVAVLQTLSPAELAFDYGGEVEVEDLESGARRLVDAAAIRAKYREGVSAFVDRCRRESRRAGLDYALLRTDEPHADALRRFLLVRAGATATTMGPVP